MKKQSDKENDIDFQFPEWELRLPEWDQLISV